MPPNNNQYDFIMQEKQKEKRSITPNFNGDPVKQKLFIASGILLLLFGFLAVILLIRSQGNDDKVAYLQVLRQQTEIVRVVNLSNSIGGGQIDQKTRNIAASIETVTLSDKRILTRVLAEKNTTFKAKDINKATPTDVDAQLTQAKAAANFESVYIDTLKDQLTDYQNNLQNTQGLARSKEVKQTLETSANHAQTLRQQLDIIKP